MDHKVTTYAHSGSAHGISNIDCTGPKARGPARGPEGPGPNQPVARKNPGPLHPCLDVSVLQGHLEVEEWSLSYETILVLIIRHILYNTY